MLTFKHSNGNSSIFIATIDVFNFQHFMYAFDNKCVAFHVGLFYPYLPFIINF